MIRFSNKHGAEYFVASGALGFDGRGWLWDKPFIWANLINLSLFTIVARTVTWKPRLYPVSNLSWVRPWTWLPWSPWSCVRFLPGGGAINKVGLYNPGIEWWMKRVAPKIDRSKLKIVGSIFGDGPELAEQARMMRDADLVAVEMNSSCPNSGHAMDQALGIIKDAERVHRATSHPIILKLSVSQDYVTIARECVGMVEAISFNSVPCEMIYPDSPAPLDWMNTKAKPGRGGVSGKPAQDFNWTAMERIKNEVPEMPVIASSIMEYDDVRKAYDHGASALSFGAIHLRTPWKPTSIVRRLRQSHKKPRNIFENV